MFLFLVPLVFCVGSFLVDGRNIFPSLFPALLLPPSLLAATSPEKNAKGVDIIVDAAEKLKLAGSNVRTIILGEGEMKIPLENVVKEKQLEDQVTILEGAGSDERRELLKLADAVVIPARAEPFGTLCLEAMASHTPVIASRNSGLHDAITHEEEG